MSFVTADDQLAARLRETAEPTEVRDLTGQVLGLFTPTEARRQAILHEKYKHLFDLEEAERTLATQRDQGRPLEEIIRDLRAMGNGK